MWKISLKHTSLPDSRLDIRESVEHHTREKKQSSTLILMHYECQIDAESTRTIDLQLAYIHEFNLKCSLLFGPTLLLLGSTANK